MMHFCFKMRRGEASRRGWFRKKKKRMTVGMRERESEREREIEGGRERGGEQRIISCLIK